MVYSVARVSAVVAMRRQDYFRQESRGWLRLHEKGGKRHDVPAHHRAFEALDDYLKAYGPCEAKAPLLQSVDPARRRLAGRAPSRRLVLGLIKQRAAAAADLSPSTCCHTFRSERRSRRICRTGECSSTRSGSPGTRRRNDNEAPRPNGGHDQRRRDRTHRDLERTVSTGGGPDEQVQAALTTGTPRWRRCTVPTCPWRCRAERHLVPGDELAEGTRSARGYRGAARYATGSPGACLLRPGRRGQRRPVVARCVEMAAGEHRRSRGLLGRPRPRAVFLHSTVRFPPPIRLSDQSRRWRASSAPPGRRAMCSWGVLPGVSN